MLTSWSSSANRFYVLMLTINDKISASDITCIEKKTIIFEFKIKINGLKPLSKSTAHILH